MAAHRLQPPLHKGVLDRLRLPQADQVHLCDPGEALRDHAPLLVPVPAQRRGIATLLATTAPA